VSWTMFENIYAISIVVDLYMDLLWVQPTFTF
jgi:hypothetical protein